MRILKIVLIAIGLLAEIQAGLAQEKIFANYFDVPLQSPKGTEVTGRLHLERNKDALTNPIPRTYQFEIVSQEGDLFRLDTKFDTNGRIMGVLSTTKNIDAKEEKEYKLTIALKDGSKELGRVSVIVKLVNSTLWNTLHSRYKDITVETPRMYGRIKLSDKKVANYIIELEEHQGRFLGFDSYTKHPTAYKNRGYFDRYQNKVIGLIEHDWEAISHKIGGLGYAYATSAKYGPTGDKEERHRLKNALYSAILAYTYSVPIEGTDIEIDGKPIGTYTGDGFSNLNKADLIGLQVATHQWVIYDALITPSVQLMPDLLKDIKEGNKKAEEVYYALVRFFQCASAEIEKRRAIDEPTERWGELRDTLHTSGAWTDANLGHRSRLLLALPIIWADYNRPMSYVQYWYSGFYTDMPKGFSFSPGWSPHGVMPDVSRWMTKYITPSYRYRQSGFQPDGTISHHISNGTDAAMVAYGFEWLTDCIIGFNQLKDTDFQLDDNYYQFPADRLEKVYPKMIYKGRFDFLVAGRSYLNDLEQFVSKSYLQSIHKLQKATGKNTQIANLKELKTLHKNIKNKTHEYSGSEAYWVNEFLVHRRGENEKPFYISLKLKSERTVGAEDFDKVRKSWYAGYGILPLKIRGDEYSHDVLSNLDWHMLPGLTEELRTDSLPAIGGSQASKPGKNLIAGVTADGTNGLGIYHHLPAEAYSSATAYKSYHFINNKIISIGTGISRLREGQEKQIVTTIDQSSFLSKLTIHSNGRTEIINPNESVDRVYSIHSPTWLHTGEKGYIIYPIGKLELLVKTGATINVTDRRIATSTPNFAIAINHGTDPSKDSDKYYYQLVPNVTAEEMPEMMEKNRKDVIYQYKDKLAHGIYSKEDKTWEIAFFGPSSITLEELAIEAEDASLFLLTDKCNTWQLTVSNPQPSADKKQLTFDISLPLKEGKYPYNLGGIYPRAGEFATVEKKGRGSRIVVELPDARDDKFYDYKHELYNAAPITINIEK